MIRCKAVPPGGSENSLAPAAKPAGSQERAARRAVLQAGLVRPLDIESLAYALVSLVDGILTQYWLSGNSLDYRRIWRVTSAALLEGIRPVR